MVLVLDVKSRTECVILDSPSDVVETISGDVTDIVPLIDIQPIRRSIETTTVAT